METLRVELGSRSYPILIGQGLLGERALFEQHLQARDLLVVSNTAVAPLYLGSLETSLRPRRVVAAILPDGESHKTLANVARILDVLVANRFGRDCAVIALGGGVVGRYGRIRGGDVSARVSRSCRCRRHCLPRWTPPWAARPGSTIPAARI